MGARQARWPAPPLGELVTAGTLRSAPSEWTGVRLGHPALGRRGVPADHEGMSAPSSPAAGLDFARIIHAARLELETAGNPSFVVAVVSTLLWLISFLSLFMGILLPTVLWTNFLRLPPLPAHCSLRMYN